MTTQICHCLKYRVSPKRVKLVKIAIIKIISIFGHPECALQSGEKKPPQSSSVDAVNDDGDDGDNLEEDAE